MSGNNKRSLRGLNTENVNDFRYHSRIKKENKVKARRQVRRKLNRKVEE